MTSVVMAPWWHGERSRLLALATQHTPRYVYSTTALGTAVEELRALSAVDRLLYAMKANPHAGVLGVLRRAGLGFECVSPGEIARLRETFVDLRTDEILFTPNFAPRVEYRDAIAAGIAVTVDNAFVLERWGDDLAGAALFLRFDPGHGAGHHAKVNTAGEASKFGIPLGDATWVAELARSAGARVVGLHMHLGSGILEAAAWRDAGTKLAAVAPLFPEVRVLDVGGGLGIPVPGQALDLAALDAGLALLKQRLSGCALWLEPGRFLAARAGVLLARVTQTKGKGDKARGTRFVGIDAGMNSLVRPALYDAAHPMVNLTRLDEPPADEVTVVGPICESGDVLGRVRLPCSEEGDVLLIADAGAYGAAMSSRYNLREPADEILLD